MLGFRSRHQHEVVMDGTVAVLELVAIGEQQVYPLQLTGNLFGAPDTVALASTMVRCCPRAIRRSISS